MSRVKSAGEVSPADGAEPARGPGHVPPGPAGQHRSPGSSHRRGHQRSIRSTLTILLVIPLVSLIALWAYAASSTVGGALAKRNSDTVNRIIGAPTQALLLDLAQERALTFVWQSARGLMPRAGMDAQRKQTDAAIAAFRTAAAAASGAEPPTARAAVATLIQKMGQLPQIRSRVDAGTLQPLAAFQAYNDIAAASFPFSLGALANPDASIPFYEQSQGVGDEAEALEFVGREAALVGGALVAGGRMSAAEHQLFMQAVDDQRFLQQMGQTPVYWQQNPDPYLQLFASPVYAQFKAMEDRIVAASPGARLPVSPAAWQSGLQAVTTAYIRAEDAARAAVTRGATHDGNIILLRLFLVGGAGLIAVVVSALLLLGFGNRITRELTGFRNAVRALAEQRMPSVVARLRAGEDVDVAAEAPALALRTRTREVTETADAFSAMQRTAVEAAVGQAQLRKGVSNVFRSLARRNQSLLQRQLKMLDEMERGTHDPEALAQLFRLDHLTTRMRRQAEGLIILSGAAPGRGWRQPVPVVEVLRGAIGEIEDYVRVDLVTDSPDFIQGAAVADVTHLLAELVENAVLYSPPQTRVQVKASRVANGYVVEVEDRGLGIPAVTLDALNERLAKPPEFDLADSDQLGLFVVSRLAARHGIKVSLRGSPYGGTAAIVLMPNRLVAAEANTADTADTAELDAIAPGRGALGRGAAGRGAVGDPSRASGSWPRPEAGTGRPPWEAASGPAQFPERTPVLASPDGPESADPGAGLDLPRRLRQASLAPQLRDAPPASNGHLEERSAEQVRALISSIQQGWRSGRAATDRAAGDTPGPNPGTAHGEAAE
jgi:signal transduction histidine kinase